MHPIRRLRAATPALAATAALVALGGALAQEPAYAPTGTLDATIDGVPVAFGTYVTVVPEPSEAIDDARARALAGRLVGRELATATTITTDPLVVNHVSDAYHPERWSGTASYQLQDLVRIELQVERACDTTLRATGRLEATLVWRQGVFQVTLDPDRTVAVTVDFAVDPVVGDEALTALLGN